MDADVDADGDAEVAADGAGEGPVPADRGVPGGEGAGVCAGPAAADEAAGPAGDTVEPDPADSGGTASAPVSWPSGVAGERCSPMGAARDASAGATESPGVDGVVAPAVPPAGSDAWVPEAFGRDPIVHDEASRTAGAGASPTRETTGMTSTVAVTARLTTT